MTESFSITPDSKVAALLDSYPELEDELMLDELELDELVDNEDELELESSTTSPIKCVSA